MRDPRSALAAVEAILQELKLETTPRFVVFNKGDAARDDVGITADSFVVSARTGEGIDALRAALSERASDVRGRLQQAPPAKP